MDIGDAHDVHDQRAGMDGLDGWHCPTSAWLDTGWVRTVDLSPNIDLESRSGASALETQVC